LLLCVHVLCVSRYVHLCWNSVGALTRRGRRAQECIPTSLLKLTAENSGRAVKMFSAVQKYMGDAGEAPAGAAKLDLVMRLLALARAPMVSFKALQALQCAQDT